MGYWGTLVAVRGNGQLSPVLSGRKVEERRHAGALRGDGWRVFDVDGNLLDDGDLLPALAADADSPILAAYIADSDYGWLVGVSHAGQWRTWLDSVTAFEFERDYRIMNGMAKAEAIKHARQLIRSAFRANKHRERGSSRLPTHKIVHMDASSPDPAGSPQSFAPLPGRTPDYWPAYESCLLELLGLLGLERPAAEKHARRPDRDWRHHARRMIRKALDARPAQEDWFEPLIRAAISEPDPSFSRDYVQPAVAHFGRRRVKLALLRRFEEGSNLEKAGAALAWYWTGVSIRFSAGTRTPTPESQAMIDEVKDLQRSWLETTLREFVANSDLDVRRCILRLLSLRPEDYETEYHDLLARAVYLARTSTDEYLRHRAEVQIHAR